MPFPDVLKIVTPILVVISITLTIGVAKLNERRTSITQSREKLEGLIAKLIQAVLIDIEDAKAGSNLKTVAIVQRIQKVHKNLCVELDCGQNADALILLRQASTLDTFTGDRLSALNRAGDSLMKVDRKSATFWNTLFR